MFLALLLITALAYVAIALSFRARTWTLDEFFMSNRTLSLQWEFASFYAAGLSLATVFIAFLELAPNLGIQILWSPITYIAGFFIVARLAPLIIRHTSGTLTLHGFLGERYSSPATQFVASAVSVAAFGGRFAAEVIVGSQILKLVAPGISITVFAVLVAATVIICTVIGGFRSVVATDRLQAVLVFVSCVTLFMISASLVYSIDASLDNFIPPSLIAKPFFVPLLVLNFFLINIPTVVVDMSIWQRLNAAKSVTVAKGGVTWSARIFIISWTLVAFAALSLSFHIHAGNGADVLVSALRQAANTTWFQAILAGITFSGLIAAMMSSADTYLIAAGQTFVRDLLKIDNKASANEKEVIRVAQISMIVGSIVFFIFIQWLFAIGLNVAGLIFIIYGTLLALFPATMVGLLLPANFDLSRYKTACLASVFLGFVGSWVYGIAAGYSAQNAAASFVLHLFDFLPFEHSPFNTPIVALILSSVAFAGGFLVCCRVERSD